ncbi:uncharacterized protein LOC144548791 [Carex rostrata]
MLSTVSTSSSLSPNPNPSTSSSSSSQFHSNSHRKSISISHTRRPRFFTTLNCNSNSNSNSSHGEKLSRFPWQADKKQLKLQASIVSDSSAADFLRYNNTSDSDVVGKLEASIVTYKRTLPWRFLNPTLQVDLVSAVHIADKRYFEILQERLGSYDCVLYEGVGGDKGESKPDDDMQDFSITGFIQRLMGRILSMEFQLDCLNYKSPKWSNADLDWDTFQRLQEERGENFLSTARNAMGSALKSDKDSDSTSVQSDIDTIRSKLLQVSWIIPMPLAISFIINITCSPNIQDEDVEDADDFKSIVKELFELGFGSAMKVILARSLTSMFASELYTDMEDNSVIIGERNKAALEELRKAISRGEKRIAIFYGAGHMPDLGRRLRSDFNMVPTDTDWVTAWSIRRAPSKYLGPLFQKYIGKFLPFPSENGWMLVSGSVFCSILLLDLWLWWSVVNAAYCTGFQMLVQAWQIM